MRAVIACLGTETNTFSPIPTGWKSFEETMLFRGDATQHPPGLFSEPMHVWRRMAEEQGIEVQESIAAFAQPGGPTTREVYESLRGTLLADIEAALPVDMVLLCMHGAMVADGYLDCEGDILHRARQVAGDDAAIGCELDLHCSITQQMTDAADAIVTFKEYPHVDGKERAAELFTLLLDKAKGLTKPTISVYDCRMVCMWPTTREPMETFVREMKAAEDGREILAVSFAHGFPWCDVPEASAKMVVVSDDAANAGAEIAAQFGRRIFALRHETATNYLSIEDGLARVRSSNAGPVILADVADNAGGGAAADSTFVLKAALDAGMTNMALGLYWDPVSVRFCKEAGEGTHLDMRLGGKCGPASGDPVDLHVTVRRILEDATQPFGTSVAALGDSVWVEADGLDIVLISIRGQTFHPDAFTQLGIDLSDKQAVVVKSSQHFHAGFAPIGSEVLYLGTPGAITPDFANIPFRRLTTPFWPRVEDPFSEAGA